MSDTLIKRTTFIVENAQRSIAFYRDVLGMTLYYDQAMTVTGNIIPAGVPGAKVQLGIMEGNHKDVAKIGLLEWVDPPLDKPKAPYRKRMGIGDIVIVTETPDIEGVYARLQQAKDCHIVCPPHDWSVPAPDGKSQVEMTTLSFFDPDGFFVEVNAKRNVPNMPVFAVRRATLLVRDINISLDFYKNVMGMDVWYDNVMSVGGQVLPAGVPDAKVRVAILKCDDPQVGMLGLTQFLDPPLENPPLPDRRLGIGDAIFICSAKDVHAIYERMQNAPVRIMTPPVDDKVTDAQGNVVKLTTMSFFDPDGFFFEVNTRKAVT
jgi:catechol 2,3-dioxygenase-like lactoylglutathione lyase family enzyme